MAKIERKYDASSIKILEGLEAVRRRPAMYIGTTDKYGLHHLVWEVVDNSVDEALAGHCDKILVTINKDNSISVIDNGRGIPITQHKEAKKPAVEVVLTTLHAGGKFDNEGYKIAGGLHGVGVSVVNALSEWLTVVVMRDGKRYENKYKRGKPVSAKGKLIKAPAKSSGTAITFMPDSQIFETVETDFDVLNHRLKELAYLNKGLEITFEDKREKKKNTFKFDGGIEAYVKHVNENKTPIHRKPIYIQAAKDNVEVEVAIQYVDDYYDEQVFSFANNIKTREGGTHLSGFRTALTRSINNFAKKYNFIKGKSQAFSGNDVREGLTCIISARLPNPQFEGQTKTKLGNSEMKGLVDSIVDEALANFFEREPSVAKKIINKCLTAQRVRNAARQAQDLARRKSALEGGGLPGKLADCIDRNPENTELFIVEGDSAGGSAKQGRDRNIQAILPLRGKILNVEKARLDKILESDALRTLITAIGPEAIENLSERSDEEDEEKEEKGNEEMNMESVLSKLRYHKIIIMTDADVDGAHIRTLLLTFFYRYAKTLIETGKVYIAQPPLFLIKVGNAKEYAYTNKQLEDKLKKADRKKANIQRYKGLGEMNPDQLWDTTMNPKTRTLLKVNLEDAELADEIFTILMGSKVEPRKEFILEHANKASWLDI
ncbi:DNA topoisomerase subunit B [Candidatus Margulisiibacteriota bacterium]